MKILDTTLRDGTQNPEVNLSLNDKLEIVKLLDNFKIDYIELGWPGSNPKDMECFLKASEIKLKHSKIVAFCSTKRNKIKAEEDLNLKAVLESKAKYACMFGKTWINHLEKQLKVTKEENLTLIKESIEFLVKNHITVFYDAEHFFDGYKDNKEYALECLKTASESGANTLVLCDTNGGTLPNELTEIIKEVNKFLEDKAINTNLGIHAHNDSGCAVANAVSSIDYGITHIQGTINGLGERTGNTDLCQVIPTLILKKNIKLPIKLEQLKTLSSHIYSLAGLKESTNQPYVGKNAFAHKGGIHVDAIVKGAIYEHIDPTLVGNKRSFVLSDLSGKANIIDLLKKYKIKVEKNDERIIAILKEIKKMEQLGYNINGLEAEDYLLVKRHFSEIKPWEFFDIKDWNITSKEDRSTSIIIGKIGDKEEKITSTTKGGPVEALYNGIRELISTNYGEEINKISLENFNVMIAEDKADASTVRVYIKFRYTTNNNQTEEWATTGISENILKASIEAIEKGFRYFIIKHGEK